MAFSSAAQVKTHLKIAGSSYDTLLAQLCTQVDAFITQETNVPTSGSTPSYTNEIIDSQGTLIIRPKHHPIASITKIEYKGADNSWIEYADEAAAVIDFDNDKIFPLYVVVGEGRRNLRVSYTAGYATAAVPSDLNLAAILIVATLFNVRNNVGFTNLTTLGLTQTLSNEDYLYVKKILTKYKSVYAI